MGKLSIRVKEIKGHCSVYNVDDKIVLDEGYRFNLKETDNVCMHIPWLPSCPTTSPSITV